MYLLVRVKDNIIIGTATKAVDEKTASKHGYKIYEIADAEFKTNMLGAKLEGFTKARD